MVGIADHRGGTRNCADDNDLPILTFSKADKKHFSGKYSRRQGETKWNF